MSKKLIEQSVELIRNVGGYLACWQRLRYPSDKGFAHTRLDKVFLNLVYEAEDGTPTFRRIFASQQRVPGIGPVCVFTKEFTYRIISGPRKGIVVSADQIGPQEHFQPAGISKPLVYARAPDAFHEYHQSDAATFELMRAMPRFENLTTLLPHMPSLYLTYRPEHANGIKLRRTGEALRWFRDQFPDAPSEESPTPVLVKEHSRIATDVGHGRLALPYAYVWGRGVVTAAEEGIFRFGEWVRVPDIRASLNGMEVCHELREVLRADEEPVYCDMH